MTQEEKDILKEIEATLKELIPLVCSLADATTNHLSLESSPTEGADLAKQRANVQTIRESVLRLRASSGAQPPDL